MVERKERKKERRNDYRKSFNSSGQLYIAGELLDFISLDVSVAGVFIELEQGIFLTDIGDFEALLKENNSAEIFIKDLMLTGVVEIVRIRTEKGKVRLGIEFRNVKYNADKLWRTRQCYRSKKQFTGYFISEDTQTDFQGINISLDGLAVEMEQKNIGFKTGDVIKLFLNELDVKGIARIVWINHIDGQHCALGLRYFEID